jgi:UDP-3-O-[3-hydroxymyristoyl] glucosamine N-acyltransferase
MTRTYAIKELAAIVGGVVRGREAAVIAGVADVAEAEPDQATWISSPKYAAKLSTSRAGVVLVPKDFGETPMPAILCERVDRAVARLLGAFAPPMAQPELGIHGSAVVHETASVGPGCAIGPHVVIEADAYIGASCVIHAGVFIGQGTSVGEDCVIWPNAVIRDGCTVGNRVMIHPGAVIGADGLGFYFDEGRHNKVPHIGGVVLEDDVEVGACACIDRAKFGNTIIGRGTKIDNLVQLAHNVRVGEHCVFAGQAGISGSVRIGSYCIFGGKASAVNNVAIGEGARLAGGLAVAAKDLPPGVTVSGFPAQDHRRELRERALIRRLPNMDEQLKALLARVKRLEESADHQSRDRV